METVLVTGSANGMGTEICLEFLAHGYKVHGIDIVDAPYQLLNDEQYVHHIANVCNPDELPDIDGVNILINNAGTQGSETDIETNLVGTINVTKKYALDNPKIKSVLNQADASAHLGTEFPEYVASKGGVIAYTKWVAKEIAKYGATCNSLSFGGVMTDVNIPVTQNEELWTQVMELTPLKKWTSVEEVSKWVYFMTAVNKSCSGQDVIIDNLESLNGIFVWE